MFFGEPKGAFMPKYVDLTTMKVVVTSPGHLLRGVGYLQIDDSTAAVFGLSSGTHVTAEQLEMIRKGGKVSPSPLAATRLGPPTTSSAPATSSSAGYGGSTPARYYAPPSVARARAVASVIELMSWIAVVICVIAGLLLVMKKEVSPYTDEWTHPYVGAGIAVAVGGSFQCLLVIMIASYIRAKMDIASRTT